MIRRLVWPALQGGVGGPRTWGLYDGDSGAFKAMTVDGLRDVEADLRSAGEFEMADAFGEHLAWLETIAERWAGSSGSPGVLR